MQRAASGYHDSDSYEAHCPPPQDYILPHDDYSLHNSAYYYPRPPIYAMPQPPPTDPAFSTDPRANPYTHLTTFAMDSREEIVPADPNTSHNSFYAFPYQPAQPRPQRDIASIYGPPVIPHRYPSNRPLSDGAQYPLFSPSHASAASVRPPDPHPPVLPLPLPVSHTASHSSKLHKPRHKHSASLPQHRPTPSIYADAPAHLLASPASVTSSFVLVPENITSSSALSLTSASSFHVAPNSPSRHAPDSPSSTSSASSADEPITPHTTPEKMSLASSKSSTRYSPKMAPPPLSLDALKVNDLLTVHDSPPAYTPLPAQTSEPRDAPAAPEPPSPPPERHSPPREDAVPLASSSQAPGASVPAPSEIKKSRSRKTSIAAAPKDLDKIDELDETDPLGFAWHHHGPYEAIHKAAKAPGDPDGAAPKESRGPKIFSGADAANTSVDSRKSHRKPPPPPLDPSVTSFKVKPGQIFPPVLAAPVPLGGGGGEPMSPQAPMSPLRAPAFTNAHMRPGADDAPRPPFSPTPSQMERVRNPERRMSVASVSVSMGQVVAENGAMFAGQQQQPPPLPPSEHSYSQHSQRSHRSQHSASQHGPPSHAASASTHSSSSSSSSRAPPQPQAPHRPYPHPVQPSPHMHAPLSRAHTLPVSASASASVSVSVSAAYPSSASASAPAMLPSSAAAAPPPDIRLPPAPAPSVRSGGASSGSGSGSAGGGGGGGLQPRYVPRHLVMPAPLQRSQHQYPQQQQRQYAGSMSVGVRGGGGGVAQAIPMSAGRGVLKKSKEKEKERERDRDRDREREREREKEKEREREKERDKERERERERGRGRSASVAAVPVVRETSRGWGLGRVLFGDKEKEKEREREREREKEKEKERERERGKKLSKRR